MFLYYGFRPILIIAAITPAILLLVQVYRADKLEREPVGLVVSLVFLGLISTIIALILESIGQLILNVFVSNQLLYNILMYFIVVGISEEISKYLILKKRTWKNPAFNCQFDGVVYAVAVSLGFALWENIGYVLQNGLGTALLRAFTAVPGHACFGVFMGLLYGMAKRSADLGNTGKAKRYLRLSVLVPALIHGTYDFIASSGTVPSTIIFIIFIVILFLLGSQTVYEIEKHDEYI